MLYPLANFLLSILHSLSQFLVTTYYITFSCEINSFTIYVWVRSVVFDFLCLAYFTSHHYIMSWSYNRDATKDRIDFIFMAFFFFSEMFSIQIKRYGSLDTSDLFCNELFQLSPIKHAFFWDNTKFYGKNFYNSCFSKISDQYRLFLQNFSWGFM